MSRELELEEKLRRSEVLSEEDIYKDFMAYAQEVKDELEIYIYMEENSIGTNVTSYWLARFKTMRQRCQLISLVDLLSRVKVLPSIEAQSILQYEHRLYVDLQKVIYGSFRGKRKVSSFSQEQNQLHHPERRKIGNIEVYIDEPCRRNYYLQDYAKYIQKEMADYCSIERNDYLRRQEKKPPSFLAKKEQHLLQLAEGLLSKNNRKSFCERNSMGPSRFSNKVNVKQTDKSKQQDYQTPKLDDVTIDKTKSKQHKRSDSNRSRDSVQILRDIVFKQQTPKSPKFNVEAQFTEVNNFFDKSYPLEEKCRSAGRQENQSFAFSFGKQHREMSEKRIKENQRFDENNEERDNAFILYSFSQENNSLEKSPSFVKSEDFQLDLLIHEIQREKYEKMDTLTFSSEIDSNQENKQQLNSPINHKGLQRTRKPFEILLETDNNRAREESYDLQDLIEFSDDNNNPEIFLSDEKQHIFQSEQKQKLPRFSMFRSEQKRLSNISEEGSYFSESKQKHSKT